MRRGRMRRSDLRQELVVIQVEDKRIVARARKMQRFFSQPFHVASQFTGVDGKYVPLADTILGFRELVDGKHDDIPEQAFYMVGTIEEAVAKAQKMAKAA